MSLPTPVLITLPANNFATLADGLAAQHFEARHCPIFRINWLEAKPQTTPQFVIATSPNAVAGALKSGLRLPDSTQCRYLAVGQATAKALQQAGITNVSYPKPAGSDGLTALAEFQQCQQQTGWLLTGEGGRPLIEQQAASIGASLERLNYYQRQPIDDLNRLKTALAKPRPPLAVATSMQALDKLKHMADADCQTTLADCHWLVSSTRIAENLTTLWPRASYTQFDGHQANDIIAACQQWRQKTNSE